MGRDELEAKVWLQAAERVQEATGRQQAERQQGMSSNSACMRWDKSTRTVLFVCDACNEVWKCGMIRLLKDFSHHRSR